MTFSLRVFKPATLFLLLSGPVVINANQGWALERLDSIDRFIVAKHSAAARVQNGDFAGALSAEKVALQIAENRFGKTHPGVVPVLEDMASIYRYMGDYAMAEVDLKWGLALREKALPEGDPLLAESLSQLGEFYGDTGHWIEADFYENRALSILEGQKSPFPGNLIAALNVIGNADLHLQKTGEALAFIKRGWESWKTIKEGTPLLGIETLSLLAKVELLANRDTDAQTHLEKALEIARKSFAVDSVELADAMEPLADFYRSQNQLEKARPLYQSALQIYKRFVGVYFGYPTLPYLQRLARGYASTGDDKSAEDLLGKALNTAGDVYGKSHPQVAVLCFELAKVEKRLGEGKSARLHLEQSLDILKSHFPSNYPLTQEVETRLKND